MRKDERGEEEIENAVCRELYMTGGHIQFNFARPLDVAAAKFIAAKTLESRARFWILLSGNMEEKTRDFVGL